MLKAIFSGILNPTEGGCHETEAVFGGTVCLCIEAGRERDDDRGDLPEDGGLGADILSLWTALPLQVDFELICKARCKHLSGVT